MKRAVFKKWTCFAISSLIALSSFGQDEAYNLSPDFLTTIGATERKSLHKTWLEQQEENICRVEFVPLSDLTDLAVPCWQKKKTKFTDPYLPERTFLESDKEVCDCLGESPNVHIKKSMLSKGVGKDETLANFRANKHLMQKRLQDLRNGMMFQASVLSDNKDFISVYTRGQEKKLINDTKQRDRDILEKTVANLSGEHGKANGYNLVQSFINPTMRREKLDLSNQLKAELKSVEIPEAKTDLLTDKPMAPGQCVPGREFLAYKQIPDADLVSSIKNKPFQSSDWDYRYLEGQLKLLTAGSIEDRLSKQAAIKETRQKMEFLNRNPMVKLFFMVSLSTNKEYFESAEISSEEQAKIINNPGWTKLEAYKKELFNIIKSADASDWKAVRELKKKTRDFFARPEVGYLTNLEVDKAQQREMDALKNPENIRAPKLPTTQRGLEALFADKRPDLQSPAECSQGGVNVETCVASYAAYCPMLYEADAQMKPDEVGVEDLSEDVTYENMDNFDLDIRTNPDFKKFNDDICNARRRSRNSPQVAKTFFEFKTEYCGKNAKATECMTASGESMQKLRREYFKNYEEIEQSQDKAADSKAVASFNSVSEGMNISKGISETEARDIARSESTPDRAKGLLGDIEKMFKGSMDPADASTADASSIVPVKASEGTTFSSFAKGMENFAGGAGTTAVVGGVEDSSTFLGSSSLTSNTIAAVAADGRITDDERDKIRAEAQEEIARSKREIQAATSAAQKENLENRMKLLEELLAQKTENESKYQKLLDQLTRKAEEKSNAPVNVANKNEGSSNRRQNPNNLQANNLDDFEDQRGRSPASYNDSSFSTGGTGGGTTGGSLGGSARISSTNRGVSRAAASFNTALLEAQEAKVGKVQKSTDGLTIVASDAETPILKSMGTAASGGTDYSLSVSAADYVGFESQNIDTLKRYQEKILGSMDSNQPVRMLVKTDKKEPLEFYVVKEGDKLFFKPIRKTGATLEALKMAVKKNP